MYCHNLNTFLLFDCLGTPTVVSSTLVGHKRPRETHYYSLLTRRRHIPEDHILYFNICTDSENKEMLKMKETS
jgi:hypothetical protein